MISIEWRLAIQFPEQPRQVPVAAIRGDESEVQAFPPQAHHHVQGNLALGAERLRLLRHPANSQRVVSWVHVFGRYKWASITLTTPSRVTAAKTPT